MTAESSTFSECIAPLSSGCPNQKALPDAPRSVTPYPTLDWALPFHS